MSSFEFDRRRDGPSPQSPVADPATDMEAVRREVALITDALPVLVSYIDSQQRYRFMNRTYERWFGRPRAEVLGKTVAEVLGEGIYHRLREPLARALAGEKSQLELRVHLPTLGERDLEVTFTPDLAPDGTVRGTVDLVTDVTERLSNHAERDRLIGELTRTVKLNELFVGILSHDLRNPLGAILMSATVLSRKLTDDGLGRTVRRILSAGERMNRMIAQLLDFTRVRAAGVLPIEPTRCDAAVIFGRAVEELAASYPGREVRFASEGDTHGLWDMERLAHVATNLVGNAVQHGSAARGVDVRVRGTDPEQLTVEVSNGATIPESLLPHLFEPFQGGQVRDRRSGLGLGLFISNEIVSAHKGRFSVASSGDTTTLTMVLPRDPSRGPPA